MNSQSALTPRALHTHDDNSKKRSAADALDSTAPAAKRRLAVSADNGTPCGDEADTPTQATVPHSQGSFGVQLGGLIGGAASKRRMADLHSRARASLGAGGNAAPPRSSATLTPHSTPSKEAAGHVFRPVQVQSGDDDFTDAQRDNTGAAAAAPGAVTLFSTLAPGGGSAAPVSTAVPAAGQAPNPAPAASSTQDPGSSSTPSDPAGARGTATGSVAPAAAVSTAGQQVQVDDQPAQGGPGQASAQQQQQQQQQHGQRHSSVAQGGSVAATAAPCAVALVPPVPTPPGAVQSTDALVAGHLPSASHAAGFSLTGPAASAPPAGSQPAANQAAAATFSFAGRVAGAGAAGAGATGTGATHDGVSVGFASNQAAAAVTQQAAAGSAGHFGRAAASVTGPPAAHPSTASFAAPAQLPAAAAGGFSTTSMFPQSVAAAVGNTQGRGGTPVAGVGPQLPAGALDGGSCTAAAEDRGVARVQLGVAAGGVTAGFQASFATGNAAAAAGRDNALPGAAAGGLSRNDAGGPAPGAGTMHLNGAAPFGGFGMPQETPVGGSTLNAPSAIASHTAPGFASAAGGNPLPAANSGAAAGVFSAGSFSSASAGASGFGQAAVMFGAGVDASIQQPFGGFEGTAAGSAAGLGIGSTNALGGFPGSFGTPAAGAAACSGIGQAPAFGGAASPSAGVGAALPVFQAGAPAAQPGGAPARRKLQTKRRGAR